ncbi:MAG: NUDIX domain-containing protein [Acidiferrobacterales bacterium]
MTAHQTLIYEGRIITVTREVAQLPNGRTGEFEVVHHPGGAATVAIDRDARVCLLRQYRHVVADWVWELPAGKLDSGEAPLAAAGRELGEEAGVSARSWLPLGRILSSPGVFSEVVHLFLARDLDVRPSQPEEHELIEIYWFPLAEAVTRALSGDIQDAKTVIGLLRAQGTLS